MISKVLLAIDGSQNALRAAEHAFKLMLMNRDMKMTVLNVIPDAKSQEELPAYRFQGKNGDLEKDLYKRAKIIFDEVMMIFNRERLDAGLAIERGEAGEIIASYALTGGYELIVMGLRGQRDCRAEGLGSVSLKVVRLAECPVTLVK